MPHDADFRKRFWDQKIIEWEDSRYEGVEHAQSWLEKLSTRLSGSLKVRMEICWTLLAPRIGGRRILELGCGSGLLASRLMRGGAASYHGIDISPAAIERAKALAVREAWADRAVLVAGEALAGDLPPSDLVIGLGFLDWITTEEIRALGKRIHPTPFLFTFSERRFSIMRYGHLIYTAVAYGWKHEGYVPRYYREGDVRGFFAPAGYTELTFVRHPKMSFGAAVHTFGAAPA